MVNIYSEGCLTSSSPFTLHPPPTPSFPVYSSPEGFGTCTLKQSVFFFKSGRAGRDAPLSLLPPPLLTPSPPTCNTSSELWHFPTGGGEKIEPQSQRPAINHLSNYNRCKSFGCKKRKKRKKEEVMGQAGRLKEKRGGGRGGLHSDAFRCRAWRLLFNLRSLFPVFGCVTR